MNLYWLLVLLSTAVAFLLYMRFKTAKFISFSFTETLCVILPVFVFSYIGGRLDVVIHHTILIEHIYNIKQLIKIFFVQSGFGNPLGYTFSIVSLFVVSKEFLPANKFLPAIDKFILLACFIYIFGNLGCFFDGHWVCRGTPTTLPWGCLYRFTKNPSNVPLHPIKLYYAFWFALCFLISIFAKRIKVGNLYVLVMISTQLFFFIFDFIRVKAYMFGCLSIRQIIYTINCIIVLLFYWTIIRKKQQVHTSPIFSVLPKT